MTAFESHENTEQVNFLTLMSVWHTVETSDGACRRDFFFFFFGGGAGFNHWGRTQVANCVVLGIKLCKCKNTCGLLFGKLQSAFCSSDS